MSQPQPKTVGWLVSPDGFREIHQSVTCAHPRIEQCQKTANLLERLLGSKFPFRHPVLYESLFELRSFVCRIRSLWKQGGSRPTEIGSVWDLDDQKHLVPNRRYQARSRGIQRFLADFPWASFADLRTFLSGFEAGEEYCIGSLGTAKSSVCGQNRESFSTSATAPD